MKKKALFVTAIFAATLSIAACSKKESPEPIAPTTVAATEATTEATTEETTEEEISEDYISGVITAIDEEVLTIQDDTENLEKKYDISEAEVIKEFNLTVGDMVVVTFPEDTTEDPIPVMVLEVSESILAQNTDSSVDGTVVDATMNTLTLEVDGENYSFGTPNAYIVAKDGITVDKAATVTYIGDLDDEPTAVKVVMEDSFDSEEAELFAYVGEVAQIGDDSKSIILVSADGNDLFTFFSDEIDFSEYSVGDTLQIEYVGTVTAKEVPATKVTKK